MRLKQTLLNVRLYLTTALLVAGATFALWITREFLTAANASLVYLLVVLLVAVILGTGPSLWASLISFLSYNFFLVKPYYTFAVADPREFLDLMVFLICAAITGQLAAYARAKNRDAIQRANEQNIIYELTSNLNRLMEANGIHAALLAAIQNLPGVKQVTISPNTSPQKQTEMLYLLLHVGDSIFGTLAVTFVTAPPQSIVRLIGACADQAALALQRIELAGRAQQSKTFQEADRLKTALLHAVSHDLRTPITIIKTSASNLLTLHNTLSANEHNDMLHTIEQEADHLDKMVGNLLDISRLNAGAMRINSAWNSLEEVAGDVASRMFQRTRQGRIKLNFPDMPLVKFDYGLILQALTNLVENSLRYEPEQSEIEIRGSIHGNSAHLAILNHGPDVPPEKRELIMEPFYHGEGGSTGLGLAIAKGIVEAHHGEVWVEDTPGGGATFIIALPFDRKESYDQNPDSG